MEQISSFNELQPYLPLIIPLVLLQLTLMTVALVDLIRREKTRWLPKWAWALIILLGQLVGPIIYFIFGREE